MAFHLPLSLLGLLCLCFPLSLAANWVSLSLTGPNGISDSGSFYYYANNAQFGKPPATESLVLNLMSSMLAVSSNECIFCPGRTLFDPRLSSTYKSSNQSWPGSSTDLGGVMAQDTVSFGGVLTDHDAPFRLIENMSQNFSQRIMEGHFGLFVDPTNATSREQHVLTRLHNAGQLLNPVVGLRLGNTPDTSHITIGALDPNDYEGTINWIQAETPDASWDSPVAIKIDGVRGFNGSFLPFPSPMLSYLHTMNRNILIPNAWTYISNDNYTGPVETVNISPEDGSYGYNCNGSTSAYVHMAVDINGVSYQIDSQDNLLRNNSGFAASGFCNVGIKNLTTTAAVPSLLGLPFLRSVFLAYRFPTPDCPQAYYGFAFPKGANRTSEMLTQQPRATPSASAQCFALAAPSSTPAVSIPPLQESDNQYMSQESYVVWQEDGKQVHLKGVNELTPGLVKGPDGDS